MSHLQNATALTPAWSPRLRSRKRGVSLLEGVLYLTLALSLIGYSAGFISEQNERQANILTASQLRDLSDAAQKYVGAEYDQIREALIGTSTDPGDLLLERVVPIADLAARGYYPSPMIIDGNVTDVFGQNYALLIRGVNADDTNLPAATLERQDVIDGAGAIDPALVDGNPANGEYELEAILVSYGAPGTSVPQRRAGPITVGSVRSAIGSLPQPLVSSEPHTNEAFGPHGSYAFNISGFSADILQGVGVPAFPQPEGGRFVSLVALSNFGALSAGGLIPGEGGGLGREGAFLRCEQVLETPGLDHRSDEYRHCLNTNEVFDEIVFNSSFDPNFRSAIRNVDDIVFNADGTGVLNMGGVGSEIQNLSEISCGTSTGIPAAGNQLSINCGVIVGSFDASAHPGFGIGDVGAQGSVHAGSNITAGNNLTTGGQANVGTNLDVGGNTQLDGTLSVDGHAAFDGQLNLTSVNGIQDVREAIFRTYRLTSGQTVPKPQCPTGYNQVVNLSVGAYSDPQGRGSVGVTTFTEDLGASWRARLVMFVDEDLCSASALYNDPRISPSANGCTGGDGNADSYEVPEGYGFITATTKCTRP